MLLLYFICHLCNIGKHKLMALVNIFNMQLLNFAQWKSGVDCMVGNLKHDDLCIIPSFWVVIFSIHFLIMDYWFCTFHWGVGGSHWARFCEKPYSENVVPLFIMEKKGKQGWKQLDPAFFMHHILNGLEFFVLLCSVPYGKTLEFVSHSSLSKIQWLTKEVWLFSL